MSRNVPSGGHGMINLACSSNTPTETSSHDLQLDWDCLDAVLNQRETNTKKAIDMEIDFLYISALARQYIAKSWATNSGTVDMPSATHLYSLRTQLFASEQDHTCTHECKRLNLKKGSVFTDPWSNCTVPGATGDVYVCVTTGNTHVCDVSCTLNTRSAKGESVVCPMSGRMKAPVISSASLSFRGGNSLDDGGGGRDEAADEDEAAVEIEADVSACQSELDKELFGKEGSFTGKRKKNTAGFSGGKSAKKPEKRRRVNGKEKTPSLSGGVRTVQDYDAAIPDPRSPIKKVCEKYDIHMQELRRICNKYMQPANIHHICINALDSSERQSNQQISAYISERKRQNQRVDWMEVVGIHASINLPKICSMLHLFQDVPVPKAEIDMIARRIMGYIRIMWRTPYARSKRLPLIDYAVTILYNMKEGYSATVHVEKSTGRVSRIPLVEPPGGFVGVREETVVFMPKYEIEPLPKQAVSRLLMEEAAKEAELEASKGTKKKKTSRAKSRRASTKSKGKATTKKPPSTMKNNSFINKCYTSVIEMGLTLEQLEEYKLKELPPSCSRVAECDLSGSD